MVSRARSKDEGPSGTALEVAASLLDVALPGVGPVFKRLAGQAQAELMRARSVALAAAERSSEMSREELADAIARNPKLIPLVTRLLHAAGQNGYDKTLKAMGTAFGEAVLEPDGVDDCELLLTSLADLGAKHTRVLEVLNTQAPIRGAKAEAWTTSDLETASGLPRRTTSLCVAALVARGLAGTSADFFGHPLYRITDLGRDLLAVLDEYASEDDC